MKLTRRLPPLLSYAAPASVALFALLVGHTQTSAHGGLQPLEDWGAFPQTASYCQRIIGRATARCALRAAQARRACVDTQVGGAICDEAATTAMIAAARRDALDEVDLHCSERDAQTIGYLGGFDLQADIIRFCRDWEMLTASAVYGPLLPPNPAADDTAQECAGAVGATVAKLSDVAFRTWRQTLDRIAVRPFTLTEKESAIAGAASRLGGLTDGIAAGLDQRCGSQVFNSIYGRTTSDFVDYITQRAGCFGGAFYIQDGTACPPSVCGNRIVEPGEACDDGNDDDTDACNNACELPAT